MKIKFATLWAIALISGTARAADPFHPPFQDMDKFVAAASDILVAKCLIAPQATTNGVGQFTVEVELVVKGGSRPGQRVVHVVDDYLEPGKKYFLSLIREGGDFDRKSVAILEMAVVPLSQDFDLATLKGRTPKEAVQRVFARRLFEIEQQFHLEPLNAGLRDRTDDIFESRGDLRITTISETTTQGPNGQTYLELAAGRLQWSATGPGETGYVYHRLHESDPVWEFASTDLREIKDFSGHPLTAKFVGWDTPGGTSTNFRTLEVGQIILARTTGDAKTVYILKFENKDKDLKSATVRYAIVPEKFGR